MGKYVEELGLLDELMAKKDKYGGETKSRDVSQIINELINPYTSENLKLLYMVNMEIPFGEYSNYSRRRKFVMDIIANICSLSLIILSIIKTLLSTIYSKNLGPYKIKI